MRIAAFTDENPIKNIFPITFRNRNRSAQPNKQPIDDTNYVKGNGKGGNQLNMRLARNIGLIISVNPAKGIETIK